MLSVTNDARGSSKAHLILLYNCSTKEKVDMFNKFISIVIILVFMAFLAACSTTTANPTPAYTVVSEGTLATGDAIPAPSGDVILTVTGKIGAANVDDTIQM